MSFRSLQWLLENQEGASDTGESDCQFSQGPNEGYFRSKSIAAVSHKNERFPTLRDKNLVSTLFESTHT